MGRPKAAVFVLAMLAGMGIFELLESRAPKAMQGPHMKKPGHGRVLLERS